MTVKQLLKSEILGMSWGHSVRYNYKNFKLRLGYNIGKYSYTIVEKYGIYDIHIKDNNDKEVCHKKYLEKNL